MNSTRSVSSAIPATLSRSPSSPPNFTLDSNAPGALTGRPRLAVAQNFHGRHVDFAGQTEDYHPILAPAQPRSRRDPESLAAWRGVGMTLLMILYTTFFIVIYRTTPYHFIPAPAVQDQSSRSAVKVPVANKNSIEDMIKSLLP